MQHPTRIQFAEQYDVTSIACGYGFSFYTVKEHTGITLFGTGINTDSQLGLQKNKWRHAMDRIIYPVPIEINNPITKEIVLVKQCGAGRAHSLILSEDGEVYTMGNNSYGQCGRPIIKDENYMENPTIHHISDLGGEKIESVICGQDHSFFITRSGKVFSCGWGADGQTGLETFETTSRPTEVHGDIKGEKIIKISSTCDFNLVLNDKGEVFGFGNTEYGQIGIGDTQQENIPRFLEITKGIGKIVDVAAGGSFCLITNGKKKYIYL